MSETTNIEWASSTGNPWIGCTKVSPGCKNCYAATLDANRFSRTMGGGTKENPVSHWGKGTPRFRTKGFWKDAIKWNKAHEAWKNQPCDPKFRPAVDAHPNPRIFPSLCDWLDDEVPIEWLADFLKLIHDTPNLDWLLLTKRPENFHGRLTEVSQIGDREDGLSKRPVKHFGHCIADDWRKGIVVPENVWLGVSVEDQQRADERIPKLLEIPARVRFLSVEPLLRPIDLDGNKGSHDSNGLCWNWVGEPTHVPHCDYRGIGKEPPKGPSINWVIVGGESGPGARSCNIEWIRSIVDQCKTAGVPCFVKQLGAFCKSDEKVNAEYLSRFWPSVDYEINCGGVLYKLKHSKGGDPTEWPVGLRVREFPTRSNSTPS